MIIRWQCSAWSCGGSKAAEYAWAMLDASQECMRFLEPDAEFHVSYQNGMHGTQRSDTTYHEQNAADFKEGPSWGKFYPARFDINQHEVWMDNDLILWNLPPAWIRFREHNDMALGNDCNFGYHGTYSNHIRVKLSSGFFGLPPKCTLEVKSGYVDDAGNPLPSTNHDQEEMGGLSDWICAKFDELHLSLVNMTEEAPCYNPLSHEGSLFPIVRLDWGRYGVHLSGANRNHFNPLPIIAHIRSHPYGKPMPPFPLDRAEECK